MRNPLGFPGHVPRKMRAPEMETELDGAASKGRP
jgi:hypothetical protein